MKISYICDSCKITRSLSINEKEHDKAINESFNGLRLFTDIHRCRDGVLEGNNLYIDSHYFVRSINQVKLPQVRLRQKTKSRIPAPKAKESHFKEIYLTHLTSNGFRLILNDETLKISLDIGKIDKENEIAISTIHSDLGGINLIYFPSNINYTAEVEAWLTQFVNAMETFIPSKIGLIIEALWYILDSYSNPPSEFDVRLLKTILASHEILFRIIDTDKFNNLAMILSTKYREKDISMMLELFPHLTQYQNQPLLYFAGIFKEDLLYLIYLFLILEREKLIEIIRPGLDT